MKVEEIDKLLADFYEGKTSENQEAVLKSYFESHDVPQRLQTDKRFFLSFHTTINPEVPEGLEEKLSKSIDNREKDEKRLHQRKRYLSNRKWITGIAASISLVIATTITMMTFDFNSSRPKDTFQDPYQAYLAMEDALIEVSSNLNDGLEQLAETHTEIKQINKQIREEIQ